MWRKLLVITVILAVVATLVLNKREDERVKRQISCYDYAENMFNREWEIACDSARLSKDCRLPNDLAKKIGDNLVLARGACTKAAINF